MYGEWVLDETGRFPAGAGARGRRHISPQDQARVAHDDEDEVHPNRPQRADGHDAADAFLLQHAVAQTGRRRGRDRRSQRARRDRLVLFAGNALVGSDGHVDMADVELRAREAGGVADGFAAGAGRLASARVAVVLRDDEEPGDAESGRVGGVYEAIEDVERGEGEAMEGTLCSNMRRQEDRDEERDERVDVHGELEGREVQAGQEGEEAVEAGDFVEEEG